MTNQRNQSDTGSGPLSGTGHRLTEVMRLGEEYLARYRNLLQEKTDFNFEHRTDMKALVEEAAAKYGCSDRVVRFHFAEHKHNIKCNARLKDFDAVEQSQFETLQDVEQTAFEKLLGDLAGSPLGNAAAVRAASSGSAGTPGNDGAAAEPRAASGPRAGKPKKKAAKAKGPTKVAKSKPKKGAISDAAEQDAPAPEARQPALRVVGTDEPSAAAA